MAKSPHLKGFGVKTEQNILDALERRKINQQRHLWWDAMNIAAPIISDLKQIKGVKKVEIAGSVRRSAGNNRRPRFSGRIGRPQTGHEMVHHPAVRRKNSRARRNEIQHYLARWHANGFTHRPRRSVRFCPRLFYRIERAQYQNPRNGHQARLVAERIWNGSREDGQQKSICRLENARTAKKKFIERSTCHYIPPELRENMGEIEAAAAGKLPRLIEEQDIRGSFHNHTTASDGRSTMKDMIEAAEQLGWEYIGISDHSKSDFQANGLNEAAHHAQIEEIHQLNASKTYRPYIFAGLECNILSDGSLDFSDTDPQKLDYVIISVHSSLHQDEKTMTRRLIRAIEHPSTTMVGHVTGRVLLQRDPYAVNLSKVIDACIANHKIIEINGNPMRMDMDWRYWHAASQKGLLCCINADAHAADQLAFVRSGINVARKGWLEKKQVINTLLAQRDQKVSRTDASVIGCI